MLYLTFSTGMELVLKREPFEISSLAVTECPMCEGGCISLAVTEWPMSEGGCISLAVTEWPMSEGGYIAMSEGRHLSR